MELLPFVVGNISDARCSYPVGQSVPKLEVRVRRGRFRRGALGQFEKNRSNDNYGIT